MSDSKYKRLEPPQAQSSGTRVRFSLAWFGGADLRILEGAPSEKTFDNTLGATVVMLACGSGLAMCLATGYMLQVPATHIWWLGLAWAIAVACGIERLILQVPTTRKRLLPLVLLPRLALALMIAVQIGEPVMLRLNQGEINNYLSVAEVRATHASIMAASAAYAPKIAAARTQVAHLHAREAKLTQRIEHYTFLSACEATTASCSSTGRLGCSTYCQHYARLAATARAELRSLRPRDRAQIATLTGAIASRQAARKAEEATRRAAIGDNRGIIAREEALNALMKVHPSIADEVWFLRLLFLSLDLLPLIAKVVRGLAIYSPYEALAEAARARDGLAAKQMSEDIRVEELRIPAQGRADVEVNAHRIEVDRDRRIDDAEGWPSKPARARGSSRSPIASWSLEEFTARMKPHERHPVTVPLGLRRGGIVGVVLVAVLAVTTVLWSHVAHHAISGLPVVGLATVLIGALAVHTRGFRRAPAWALRATFATLVTGLVLPIVVLGMNW